MFGKPGVPRKAVTPRYNHATNQKLERAHLGRNLVDTMGPWEEVDGDWYRLPAADEHDQPTTEVRIRVA